MFMDSFNYSINVFEHVYVRKAQHGKSKHLKMSIPCPIFLHPIILIMFPTIYLHDEFSLWAVKVHDAMTDIFLPVEL